MKYCITWKSIAFPNMDVQSYVEADSTEEARAMAEAAAPSIGFQEVYYIDDVKVDESLKDIAIYSVIALFILEASKNVDTEICSQNLGRRLLKGVKEVKSNE